MAGRPHLSPELFQYDFAPLLRREKNMRVYLRLLGLEGVLKFIRVTSLTDSAWALTYRLIT